MKGSLLAQLTLILLSVLAFSGQTHAQEYVPGEVIVRLKGDPGSPESFAFLGKATYSKAMSMKESWTEMNMYHFTLSKGQSVETTVQDLKADPNVLYAEPNYIFTKLRTPVYSSLSALAKLKPWLFSHRKCTWRPGAPLGVQSVWITSAIPAVKPVVAVIDTGLDINHFVIQDTQALWINEDEIAGNGIDDDGNGYVDDRNGWNFVDGNGNMHDDDGHGTHVSGVILSVDQNIYATPRRESKIRIMPLKFLNGNGVGTTSNAIRAVYYAVNNGAKVLNNSWGGPTYSAALHEAVAYTYAQGAIFVAAAGNAGQNNDSTPMYPASYDVPNVMSIAATTDFDYLAWFSNFGVSTVDLGSPGVEILSIVPNNSFGTSNGTSMATPFVSGTAAQMKVEAPNMLGYQLKSIMLSQYNNVSQLAGKVVTAGRLNSSSSVTYAKTASLDSSQPSYTLIYQADRQLASSIAGGGGCGTVKALGGDNTPFGSAGAIVLLILAPLAVLLIMRLRAPANRRKHERFKINSDVRISVGDRELVGSVSSISLGGAQVNTAALLQDGGLVTLTISSPQGGDMVEVAGRVVWSEANKAYGVAFAQAPQSVLSRIADWTRALQKAA
ncbi:MAG: S8 family serine peptidase [Bdellovibrionaceae bacterium]|nr:S8 family serine peptidase [Pseudobdellovibrionaceae bacterium]